MCECVSVGWGCQRVSICAALMPFNVAAEESEHQSLVIYDINHAFNPAISGMYVQIQTRQKYSESDDCLRPSVRHEPSSLPATLEY